MANKESVDEALEKYEVRRGEVASLRKLIESLLNDNVSNTSLREIESSKSKKDINDLRDIRNNTLRDSKLKGAYDKYIEDGIITDGEAITIIGIQKDIRANLEKAITASIKDEKRSKFAFNRLLAETVDEYLENLTKVTKGLKPKFFLKAVKLRALVATLELDDETKVDITENISAEDHPVQEILNLIKII